MKSKPSFDFEECLKNSNLEDEESFAFDPNVLEEIGIEVVYRPLSNPRRVWCWRKFCFRLGYYYSIEWDGDVIGGSWKWLDE